MARSFARLLEAVALGAAERPAVLWEGGTLTHGDLDRRAGGFARVLAERGAKPGDRIAIAIGNRPEFAVALLAGLKAGATVAPIDPLLTPGERRAILADLRPAQVVDDVPDGPGGPWPSVQHPDAPALILYTSGSTGTPKGAALSHGALAFANASWAGPVMALGPDDVVLAVLPLAHSFGLNGALLAPLLAGAATVLVERFSPEAVVAAIRAHRATVLPAVATMFRRVLDLPDLVAADLASLRFGVSGAAPCPWELAEEWRTRTGRRILRGYGMTELFRPISYLADDPRDLPSAVGRPVPGVEIRLAADDGSEPPQGEPGELWVKSPATMDGYIDSPEETDEVLRDGWFRTGDLATVDGEGFVTIAGRKRERILRGGHSVFPAEVERVLLSHPDISEAAVVGLPHPELGEEVAAFIVVRAGADLRPEDVLAYCRERLAGFKYPRHVERLDALPRNATGKIQKTRLAGRTHRWPTSTSS